MAHAALISLRLTIKRLINSSHVMISPPSRKILDDLRANAKLFQEFIQEICKKWNLDEDVRGRMKDLQRELREASCVLEDALEIHFLDLILASDQGDDNRPSPIPFDMMLLEQATITFNETLNKYTPPDDHGVVPGVDFGMVGVEDDDDQEEDDADGDDDYAVRLRAKYGIVLVKEEEEEEDDDDDDDQEEEREDDDDVTSMMVQEDDDDDNNVTLRNVASRVDHFGSNKSKVVGFEEEDGDQEDGADDDDQEDDADADFLLRLREKYGLVGVKEEDEVVGFEDEDGDQEDDEEGDQEEDEEGDDSIEVTSKMVREEEEDDDDNNVASRIDLAGEKSNIVGFSDIIGKLKDLLLLAHWEKSSIQMVSLVGMAGIGKTALAKEIYEDPTISKSFPHRVWITVGQKYRVLDVIKQILVQLSPETKNDGMDYFTLSANITKSFGRAGGYLIVLDDVWDRHLSSNFMNPFLKISSNHRILILFTTRQAHVGAMAEDSMLKLRLMDKEESWDLLRAKVFGEKSTSCPPQLVKSGKKIAENCDGLPLTIVTVADHLLSKADNMTPEYWKMVAEKENTVLTDAYDQISEVLYRSYDNLPEFLKALYLYLAIFPPNSEITVTKISMLWDAEGFDEKNPISTLDTLEDFVLFSLVLERRGTYNNDLKACVLHAVFWHLCVREARENKLFHVLKKIADSSAEGIIRNQRRLCIHNNVLFGIKDANNSMASSASTARSLLCTGPHHQYPVPIRFGDFRLLRVIDTLTIRFYEFPDEVVKLVQLRYLALVYDRKLPPTISKLWNLQFLIVYRYLSILKPHEDESYLPVEIWGMKELKHLQVMGSNLLDPPRDGACLPNLVTLLGVSARSCTKGVLEGLPKLEKLGVRIELPVDDVVHQPFSCFDHISHLGELSSLKCVVVNPKLGLKVVLRPPASSSLFPERLRRLSLSGCGYTWEDMRAIASLQSLKVLKLQCYAFRGQIWEIKEEDFRRLESLTIEDTDLVQWIVGSGCLRRLERLILKNCYKLEDIQGKLGESLECVEIDDCNLSAVNYAKQLQSDNSAIKLSIHLSCNDVNVKRSQQLD